MLSLFESIGEIKQAIAALQPSNTLVVYRRPQTTQQPSSHGSRVDHSDPPVTDVETQADQALAATEISELRKQLADTRNACLIASEDANRWNLLAVERLAEIGRLEACSSLVDHSKLLEPTPESQVEESEPLEDVVLPVGKSKLPVDPDTLQVNAGRSLPVAASEPPAADEPVVEVTAIAVDSPPVVTSELLVDEPPADEPEEEAAGVEKAIAATRRLITAAKLATLLKVHPSSVGRAAKDGHEKFMKWSSEQKGSAGRTWDFILVKKGGKEVPQFFTRY